MRLTGQSTMEFVSSNATLLVLIIFLIAALLYLGSANAGISVRTCIFPGQISCISYSVGDLDGLYLEIGQTSGTTMQITSVSCSSTSTEYFQPLAHPVSIPPGTRMLISGGDSGNYIECNGKKLKKGELYRGDVCLTYTESGYSISKTACGEIITPVT